MGIEILLVIVLIVLLAITITEYNIIKKLYNKVLQSRSSIDIALNQRFDLIPNLIECVKGYAKHEEKVLETIMKERTEFYKTGNLAKGSELVNKFNQILALAEKYPELKTSDQFLSLQGSLKQVENVLQASRRLYNSDVTVYNTKISTFPGNIFANIMKMESEELFQIEEYKRDNVNIK